MALVMFAILSIGASIHFRIMVKLDSTPDSEVVTWK
jgi:hypothetical protein